MSLWVAVGLARLLMALAEEPVAIFPMFPGRTLAVVAQQRGRYFLLKELTFRSQLALVVPVVLVASKTILPGRLVNSLGLLLMVVGRELLS
jgi:hypothetical protein